MRDKPRKKSEEALLQVLACGATAESAASKCGVSRRTVCRRLEDPDFRRRLQKLRAEIAQRTSGALTAASTEAVRTLLELLKAAHSGTVRLGAARATLELGMKLRENVEFETRLAALEAATERPS
jgi:hypothetical protein